MITTIFNTDARTNDVFSSSVESSTVPTRSGARGGASLVSAVGSTVVAASLMLFATDECIAISSPTLASSVVTVEATSHPGLPGWWNRVQQKLTSYQEMPSGWERNAKPISANAVAALLSFLESAASFRTPPPSVVPMVDGGVQAEWHTAGFDIEVSANGDGEVITYVATLDGEEFEQSISPSSKLDGWIDQLLIPANA